MERRQTSNQTHCCTAHRKRLDISLRHQYLIDHMTKRTTTKGRSRSLTLKGTDDAAEKDDKIASLQIERRSLRSLKAHPKNPRKHPAKGTPEWEALAASLADDYFDPLILNTRNGMLIGGHLRKKIMISEGKTHADVVVTDCDEKTHIARMIAANKSTGVDDLPRMSDLLAELKSDSAFDIRLTGMTLAQVESITDEAKEKKSSATGDDSGGVKDEDDDDAETSFEIYTQQEIEDDAFTFFREKGFPYRDLSLHRCKQEINRLAALAESSRLRSKVGYHVADTFHKHRFAAAANGSRSPLDSFSDDLQLKRAIRLEMEHGSGRIGETLFSPLLMVRGTQACANFRPAFASLLYREFCLEIENPVVLDTSTGYGGRLVGFMGSNLDGSQYIGIDPNTVTHAGNVKMSEALNFSDRVTLINLPAEDVDVDEYDIRGTCDFAFTSPPYFTKELYSEEATQSCVRYQEATAWRNGFLKKMLQLQFDALKKGATNIVNIADVTVKSELVPLSKWIVEDAIAVGFEFIERRDFEMTRRFGANQKDEVAVEPVFIFRKPD
jgi:hypothetical protein